jgi:hypothetical protein
LRADLPLRSFLERTERAIFRQFRVWFGRPHDKNTKQTSCCAKREYPIFQAKPEHSGTPPPLLLELVIEFCKSRIIMGEKYC